MPYVSTRRLESFGARVWTVLLRTVDTGGHVESEGKVKVDSGIERARSCFFSLNSDQEGMAFLYLPL